jgi:hypothetical protein
MWWGLLSFGKAGKVFQAALPAEVSSFRINGFAALRQTCLRWHCTGRDSVIE